MKIIARHLLGCVTLLAALAFPILAAAGSITIPGAGASFTVELESFQERRFTSVVRQQYDYSCGSAAVATLLSHHYEDPVSEQDVFDVMYENGDKAKINEYGFSLLDMKDYLESRGYYADGFRVPIEKLAGIGVPAIALINANGYLHFVVVKGISSDRLLVGDPARGLRMRSREQFESMWNGIFFLVRNKADIGRDFFNAKKEWARLVGIPHEAAISRAGLASFALSLPIRGEF